MIQEIENPGSFIVIKKYVSPQRNHQAQIAQCLLTFIKEITLCLLQRIKKKEILLNMFYEVNITLINKCGKDIVRKKTQSFCEHRCETSEQNICKWN